MKIARLDHLVLTVADIERTCAFYTRVLGMQILLQICCCVTPATSRQIVNSQAYM